ncbi:hypothetical protein [Chlorobium phaeobacteroides]|uniref:Uncharacterized protein n=1 Tax=Chlorobium phaeobacteroides (strain DSM 266 / SMG 266 / 2430) TaxID=290317 RepID=A1BI49_CHLPD|nr:hypothetical protein [Chlorobium phaeobacteroides]ABL66076.1 hypothetical protein Cpha266_2064 [Chlorobium phaeobacteroides DSM 266]
MRHFQAFVRASAITVVCVALFFNNALAIDAVPWLKLSEEARFAFVIGFNAGVSHGAVSAGAEAQRIYVPSTGFDQSQSFEEMVNSPEAKRNWENSVRIQKVAMKESGLRHGVSSVVDQMDFLYKDPATKVIGWSWMIGIAQDRLDGKDVSGSINSMIKADKFWDTVLRSNEPVFNFKKSK